MRKYETIAILDERPGEKNETQFQEEFEAFLKSLGANIIETIPMGKKQFTYQIKKKKAGIYLSFKYELSPAKSSLVKEKYRLDERVLRMRTFIIE